MKTLPLLACGFLANLSTLHAVILYGLDNTSNNTYASLVAVGGGDIPWHSVVRIGGVDSTSPNGTGIYLGDGYVLTAHHVNPLDTPKVELDGDIYSVDPFYTPQQVASGVDLHIFRILGAPSGFPSIPLYSGTSEVGPQTSVMIGWGQGKGTVISGQGWNWGGDITNDKRWGTNQVEWTGNVSGGGYNYQALATWFDSDQGPWEYSATLRDSGSPVFQFHSGEWQLVSIITSVEVNGQSLYSPAQYTVGVRISEYRSDILAIIPEPSTASLLLAALLLGFLRIRETKRRARVEGESPHEPIL